MAEHEQLEWERRAGRLAAGAAFGSVLLTIATVAIRLAALGQPPPDDRGSLLEVHEHSGALAAMLAVQAASHVLLALALFYLLRVTAARRPELPRIVLPVVLLAPVLLTVGGVLDQVNVQGVADDFVAGERSESRAEDLLEDRNVVGAAIAQGGSLCLALSFMLVSLNAMRAGLLSRFMGILGVIVGALMVLPLVPGGGFVIQAFWMAALGALFLGLWPGGRGPAWEAGEAVPWPSAAERRGEAMPHGDPEKELVASPEPQDAQAGTERPSKKRKRKRRR